MSELAWTAKIEVSDHAVHRSQERLGWSDRQDIRDEVRSCLLEDRVSQVRPNWTRGDLQVKEAEDVRYAWDPEGTRCWVVAVSISGTSVLVKTLLLRNEDHIAANEQRLLRRGTVRR